MNVHVISNSLVDLAKSRFNDALSMQELEKLNFSEEHKRNISLGLTIVGITLFADYGVFHALPKHMSNRAEIRSQIVGDTLTAFAQQTITEGVASKTFGDLWDSTLKHIANDINKGIQNPQHIWGENERGGLKMGGVLGVILRKVFQTESTSEIFSDVGVDLFTFLEVSTHFDSIFRSSMASVLQDVGNILGR